MLSDKEVKELFRKKAAAEPEKHYPVGKLREHGFVRGSCSACGKNFWATDAARKVCGDSACSGGYQFIGNSPAKKEFDYIGAWKAYRDYFEGIGYAYVDRYPVVARWRDDVYWVGAGIYVFQPWVVSGKVKPKSNAVIEAQASFRFNDIDNVGITSSHYVCFDMLGQHRFEPKDGYDVPLYFDEYLGWLVQGMGVPKNELVLHEDAWAGGGNLGPCIEFFSRGCELGNQVYMQYRVTPQDAFEELDIKVLDMGQGHERIPWFSQGKSTSYETTFPDVVKRLKGATGVKADEKLLRRFLPYAAYLNVDEVEDIDSAWETVAGKVGLEATELKDAVLPLQGLYSVAEHSRAALVALHDGAVPSNVGGGYNLRAIMRRAFDFMDKYEWKLDFGEVASWHSAFLKPMWPELDEGIEEVRELIDAERRKHRETRQRAKQIVERELGKGPLDTEKLVELYDSQGISPELVQETAASYGKGVRVPDNFFGLVSERHERRQREALATATKREQHVEFGPVKDTEVLYYQDWETPSFEATVAAVKDKFVVLDATAFFPTSGGQEHDLGEMNGIKVIDAFKQGNVVVHVLEAEPRFGVGEKVKVSIDLARRKQLTQHHTGTHILLGEARKQLGRHAWQAGAAKTVEKGRLDLTHYENLSTKQLDALEEGANRVIQADVPVKKRLEPREEAEEKYGFVIYQGGHVPGRTLRIVEVEGHDVEACGGTHVRSTREVEQLKILGSTRIQDGIVRINFVCGEKARETAAGSEKVLAELAAALDCSPEQVPGRAAELFENWKKARKLAKKGASMAAVQAALTSTAADDAGPEQLLAKAAEAFSTQPEHAVKTAKRFLAEIEAWRKGK